MSAMTASSAQTGDALVLPAPGEEWWRAAPQTESAAPVIATPEAGAPRGGLVPFLALMVFLVLLLLAPQAWLPALAPLRLPMVAAVTAITAHTLRCLFQGRPITIVTREIALAACLAALAFATVPLSTWPGGSLDFLLDTFLKSLAVFWLIANLVSTSARLNAMSLALSIISVPLASVAVTHFLNGPIAEAFQGVTRIVGYRAPLTENPNDLALMLNLLLPFTIAQLAKARGPAARALFLAIAALDSVAIVLTFSRAGFLTLGLTLSLYLWTFVKGTGRGWALAFAALAVLALPLLPGSYLTHMETITDISSDPSGSAQARWEGMVTAVKLTLQHPILGAGAGLDVLALNQERGPTWKEVHNVFLEYGVDLGLPGLALFVALLICCLGTARRVYRAATQVPGLSSLRHDALAVAVGLCAFALAGMFHPAGYHFYFYIIAGLAVALATIQTHEAPSVAH